MAYTILEQVKIRLKQFHIDESTQNVIFDKLEENPLLEQLIEQAKQDIITRKNYPASWDDNKINADLDLCNSTIVNLVLYDRNKLGGEYRSNYSENGISVAWESRDTILADIMPFVKVL